MKYRVTKTFSPDKGFSCAFRNWRAPSHCHFLHGYDLIFEVTFEADELDEYGWVVDYGSLDHLKHTIERTFDHKTIVANDDPDMDWYKDGHSRGTLDLIVLPQVSTETFALWLAVRAHQTLSDLDLGDRVRVYSACVYEHGANRAEFFCP